MARYRFLPVIIVLTILLALSAGLSAAQGPAPQGQVGPQAMVGSAFTYQGQLLKDGNPVNDTCTMVFSLYDDVSAGSLVGDPITQTVTVANGLFTTALNSGGEFGLGAFSGNARWLEIAVQCTGDAALNTLTPRQELTAAPYALSLRPGAMIDGAVESGGALVAVNRADYSYGVWGQSDAYHDAVGVRGLASSYDGGGTGVWGEARTTDGGVGVRGEASGTSGTNYGVYGVADSQDGYGVYGTASYAGVGGQGDTYGVYGLSPALFGHGVYGEASATFGANYGVYGLSASEFGGRGVYGEASATSGTAYGVQGVAASPDGYGVYGLATASSGDARGVLGVSASTAGTGVYGLATATSGDARGVYGESASDQGAGVYGYAPAATSSIGSGVYGESYADQGAGVWGRAYGSTALADGVRGYSYSEMATGVAGIAWTTTGTAIGVFGQAHSPIGYAGQFSGNVYVNGTLSADAKLFKIDHPFDPANKYLYHYSVESSEVLNQYSGNAVLDAGGSAWVELPDWFSAINQDVRYQLTPVGAAAPGLYIAQKVRDNRFQIAGGPPGLEVSWEITAVRNDPYIQRYGAPVEVEKPATERGTYLHPELYGQPEELGLQYRFTPDRPDADLVPDTTP